MLDLAQLLQTPYVDTGLKFDVSPDKSSLVFSWNSTGTWRLYQLEINRSSPPRPLTAFPGAQFSPRYSPDGTKIAFAFDLNGSESYHIAIHDLVQQKTTDITPDIAYAHHPNVAWSPDGETLAVLSDAKGQFALYLLPLDCTPPHMIKNVFHPCWDAAWSPDGRWIALESESKASERSIYLVPIGRHSKGPKRSTIQLKAEGRVLNAQQAAWSPDSRQVAFSAEGEEWHEIGVFDFDTQEIAWITNSSGDDVQPAWSPTGNTIGWIHHEGPRTSFQFKIRDGVIRQANVGEGVHAWPQFRDDTYVILLYEDPKHPSDIWELRLDDGKPRALTNSMPDNKNEEEFIYPEEVWYEGMDGAKIPALLYRAENGSSAVLNLHGGPNWNQQFAWDPLISHMASRGWSVLVPNYRGSTGYGKKWQNASLFDMGGVDNDDCAAGATYLIENRLAVKNKICVTGRSHGGYLTMTCLTGYPHLFAAGSAVVPFLNWIKSHYNSREDLQHWNIENMGDPEENKDLWTARSPYFFLDKVAAPVQLICGENDPRCPASDSMDARDKLYELGKEVDFLLYVGEGHSFLDIRNVLDSEMKRVAFLAQVLDNG